MDTARWRRVWLVPIALGLLSGVGLVAALLSDGPGDVLSWLALAVPVAVSLKLLAQALGWRLPNGAGDPGP